LVARRAQRSDRRDAALFSVLMALDIGMVS
jgi:hypothetical protein